MSRTRPMARRARRPRSFYPLAAFFMLFVLFLYGPTFTIVLLSFQGPQGGLTFPMNGVSLHWFASLFEQQMVGDFAGSFRRSLLLGVAVMVVTVVFSFLGGLAFRRGFRGASRGLLPGGCQPHRAVGADRSRHRAAVSPARLGSGLV